MGGGSGRVGGGIGGSFRGGGGSDGFSGRQKAAVAEAAWQGQIFALGRAILQ
jgi:hypothetical protein